MKQHTPELLSGINLSVQMGRIVEACNRKPWEVGFMTKPEIGSLAQDCQQEADRLHRISRLIRGCGINPESVPDLLEATKKSAAGFEELQTFFGGIGDTMRSADCREQAELLRLLIAKARP